MHFERLLDWRFWFALRPSVLGERTVLIVAIGFAALLIIAVFFRIFSQLKRKNPPLAKLTKKIYKLFATMALVGFILLFLAYEQIYLLGSHFWLLLWLVGFLVWLGFIVYYAIVKMPREREDLQKKQRFLKYLAH